MGVSVLETLLRDRAEEGADRPAKGEGKGKGKGKGKGEARDVRKQGTLVCHPNECRVLE